MAKYVVTERAGVGVKHDGKLYAPGDVIEADAPRGMKALVEAGAVKLKGAKRGAGAGAKSINIAGKNVHNTDGY